MLQSLNRASTCYDGHFFTSDTDAIWTLQSLNRASTCYDQDTEDVRYMQTYGCNPSIGLLPVMTVNIRA